MTNQAKILLIICCFFIQQNKILASSFYLEKPLQSQIDSLIEEKNIDNDMTQLELLVLYHDAWTEKHPDSINIFKNLAILNADLVQPKDAKLFTEKYINNTLDFSILNDKAYASISDTEEYDYLMEKYMVNYNLLTFFYLYVALIGFFFMIVINFTKKANKLSKILIASFIGANSLFILEFVIYTSNLKYQYPHTYLMASSFALLYGPFLYFYFKSVVEDYNFRKIDLLHFIPTLILLFLLAPFYLSSSADKINIMLGLNNSFSELKFAVFISKVVSLSAYGFFIGRLQYKRIDIINEKLNSSVISWMKNIFIIHIIYTVSYTVYGLSILITKSWDHSVIIYNIQMLVMAFMILYIAYMAYVQPAVFNKQFVSSSNGLFFEKYKKSGLTESLSSELKENLVRLMITDKIYKESNISLEILSEKLNTTRHNTSQIINEHFDMNFFELINKFRIEEAINIIKEDKHGSLNIIDIAYEVGFNNKVTFNKAFKKETSMTPSEFISSQFENSY